MTRQVELAGQGEYVTIFYLDDDQDDLDSFRDVVEEMGGNHSIYTHDHWDKLMFALDNPPPQPQILFLDLNMPGKSGIQVLQEVREKSNLNSLPVVILSTSQNHKTIAECRALGANMYIPKMGDYFRFKEAIQHALRTDWARFNPEHENFFYSN